MVFWAHLGAVAVAGGAAAIETPPEKESLKEKVVVVVLGVYRVFNITIGDQRGSGFAPKITDDVCICCA